MTRKKLTDLIAKHYGFGFKVAKRVVHNAEIAEEIVQEACIKVLLKHTQLESAEKFRSWFRVIIMNLCRTHLRYDFHWKRDPYDVLPPQFVINNLEDEIGRKRAKESIATKAAQLPRRQHQAYELRAIRGLGFTEIARQMNCAYDTAKANYRHAERKLKA